MMLLLNDVLTAAEVREIRARLERVQFADGAKTAGVYARTVKRNEQAEGGPETQKLQEQVATALFRHPQFEMAARPKTMKPIMFSRYEPGMEYGTHVDNALMSGRPPVRSDLSFTLFLAQPDSYDGGELVVESPAGDMPFKLPAGSAILYPSSTLHHVAPVTRGARIAAVSWIQSYVRDPARREMLFDLETTRRSLFEREGKSREFDLVSKTFANLLRMWAEI
jgi:PKHD-type hydroxylase